MADEVFYYVDRNEPEQVTVPSLLLSMPISQEACWFYLFLSHAVKRKTGFYTGARTLRLAQQGVDPERALKELLLRRMVSLEPGERSVVTLNPTHLWHVTPEPPPLDVSALADEEITAILAFEAPATPQERLQVLIESWFRSSKDFHTQAAELNLLTYQDFLHSPYWRVVREYALERARYRCELCGSKRRLNVHHKTYEHHGLEHLHTEDLIVLCKRCHARFHGKVKGGDEG